MSGFSVVGESWFHQYDDYDLDEFVPVSEEEMDRIDAELKLARETSNTWDSPSDGGVFRAIPGMSGWKTDANQKLRRQHRQMLGGLTR